VSNQVLEEYRTGPVQSRSNRNLFDYLKAGESTDEFLEGFLTVKRKAVVSPLTEACL